MATSVWEVRSRAMPAANVSLLSWSKGISTLPVSSNSHFSHLSAGWANTAVSIAFAELEISTPLEEVKEEEEVGGMKKSGEKVGE